MKWVYVYLRCKTNNDNAKLGECSEAPQATKDLGADAVVYGGYFHSWTDLSVRMMVAMAECYLVLFPGVLSEVASVLSDFTVAGKIGSFPFFESVFLHFHQNVFSSFKKWRWKNTLFLEDSNT